MNNPNVLIESLDNSIVSLGACLDSNKLLLDRLEKYQKQAEDYARFA